jgi:hypothetical protein
MIVAKVTRVANGKRRAARRSKPAARRTVRRSSSNPAHMLTLAFPNHKRRATMATKAKKRNGVRRRKTSVTKRPHYSAKSTRSNHRRRNGRRRRSNPSFFGASVTPVKMAEYVAAGLVGNAVNRAIVAALPASVTSNNVFATGAALAIAVAQWWLGAMASKDLGSAFGFGALMNATSTALNTFIPSVGSYLSGVGRIGDFVPAQIVLPPQPSGIGGLASYNNLF